jgi:polysaccharide pyruvyl transferase WcaK-like protein
MTAGEWPNGHPRVLVSDAWLTNAGDGAIALALDRLVRSVWPGAAVLHAAYQSELLGAYLDDLTFAPPLDALLGVKGADALPAGWTVATGDELVRGADLVISQGGGFLFEHYQPWQRLLVHARVIEMGLRFAYLAQSIGRFRAARARALLRKTLSAAVGVSVRDPESVKHVLEQGAPRDRVALTSDLALTLFAAPREAPSSPRGVAVVLTAHDQEGSAADAATRRRLSAAVLSETVERVPLDEPVTLVSTVQGLGHLGLEDDHELAKTAVRALPARDRTRVDAVAGFRGTAELITLLSRQRAVVTQRLHPAIFALGSGVPAAVLTSAGKLGVFDGVDLDAAFCATPEVSETRRAAIDTVLRADAPRGRALWDAIAPARERAARNADILASFALGAT